MRSARRTRRDRARARRGQPVQAPVAGDCPTPAKARYVDEHDARRSAASFAHRVVKDEHRYFEPLYGYLCPCGGWHMTRRPSWDGVDHVLLYAIADHLQQFALETPTPEPPALAG
jgi:hypothetical protein